LALHSHHSTRIEQPGAEILVPLQSFWERFGRIVLGVAAGLLVVGVIAFMGMRSRRSTEDAAAGKLAEASYWYWQGDAQRSLSLGREVIEQYGSTQSGRDAHRQVADAAFFLGDFKVAVDEYRLYLAAKPKGILGDAARRCLAYALESQGQYVEAAREYEALVGRLDRGSSAEFLVGAARCLEAAGQGAAAVQRLQRAVSEFGETESAAQARITLAELAARPGATPPTP
jgi:tetratricopeptide (TPR) repeat protein